MAISEKDILDKTHYGLNIYARIMREFYPGEILISLSGKQCKTTWNPFLGGSETLVITNQDWVFVYHDTSNPDFKGTPFDFAKLFYKLEGQELLQKINEDLYLNIGKQKGFYRNQVIHEIPVEKTETNQVEIPYCSFFKAPITNTKPQKTLSVAEIYQLIKQSEYKTITEQLRSIPDSKKAKAYKANHFDYVTFNGIFTMRNDNNLQKPSGLLVLDFDHLPDHSKVREQLLNDANFETALLFTSPSGDGIKWVVCIDLAKAPHLVWFQGISNYLKKTYQLEADKSGKDLSRACFLPHDNSIFINSKFQQNEK